MASSSSSLHKVRGGYKQVSQRALSAVLEEIHEHGIPKARSRSSIKRSKELEVDVDTPFGKLFVGKTLKLAEKFKSRLSWEFHFINPLALLHHMAINCAEFSLLFAECLEKQAPSHERPLSIACYADEVTPGNPLAHRNSRKFQVSYWSIANLGAAALSCERLWFPLFVARSEVVKKLPGRMAQLVKEALCCCSKSHGISGLVMFLRLEISGRWCSRTSGSIFLTKLRSKRHSSFVARAGLGFVHYAST